MRSDMNKVIVERPRIGHSDGFHDWRRAKDFTGEDAPYRESMKVRYGWNTKSLNENLRPLERWINAQVGRKWDDVYSDICSNFNKNKTINQHILDHLFQYIERCVEYKEDGTIHNGDLKYKCRRYAYGNYTELHDGELYVDKDGKVARYHTKQVIRKKNPARKNLEYEIGNLKLVKQNGIWYMGFRVKQEYMLKHEPVIKGGEVVGYTPYYIGKYPNSVNPAATNKIFVCGDRRNWKKPKAEFGYTGIKQCPHNILKKYGLKND